MQISSNSPTRGEQKKNLGFVELIAIGVGGMIGGGIFSILGLAVDISAALLLYAPRDADTYLTRPRLHAA